MAVLKPTAMCNSLIDDAIGKRVTDAPSDRRPNQGPNSGILRRRFSATLRLYARAGTMERRRDARLSGLDLYPRRSRTLARASAPSRRDTHSLARYRHGLSALCGRAALAACAWHGGSKLFDATTAAHLGGAERRRTSPDLGILDWARIRRWRRPRRVLYVCGSRGGIIPSLVSAWPDAAGPRYRGRPDVLPGAQSGRA